MRQAFLSLAKDEDFLTDAVKTMRFQPRFEVGQSGEALFKRASQTSPEIITFLRQYIEQGISKLTDFWNARMEYWASS
jgi:hypothetical protein